MRTIIARFEIDDNDLIEHKLFTILDSMGCKDFKKLPDTKELYENDSVFRQLSMKRKAANRAYNDYINKTKLK
tara:strand:+ start:1363 stop:1581 length:219 start_codon:yes stop_codon:yes gene_type:complete